MKSIYTSRKDLYKWSWLGTSHERRKKKVIDLFFILGIIKISCVRLLIYMQKFQNAEVRIPYTYVQSYQITRLSISSSNRVDRELNHTLYQKLRSTGQQFPGTSRRSRFFFLFFCFFSFRLYVQRYSTSLSLDQLRTIHLSGQSLLIPVSSPAILYIPRFIRISIDLS